MRVVIAVALWGLAGVLAAALFACDKVSERHEAHQKPMLAPALSTKRVLTIAAGSDVLTFCPLVTDNTTTHQVLNLVNRDMLNFNAGWQPIPGLSALPQVALSANAGPGNAPVPMRVTWHLRPHKWQDGKPVVAGDFIALWQLQKAPAQEIGFGKDVLEKVTAMRSLDNGATLQVDWREVYRGATDIKVHKAIPAHAFAARLAHPDTSGPLRSDPLCAKPLSNGPYQLSEWQQGVRLVFERNPHFFPSPLFDQVVVRVVPEASTLLAMMNDGQIDATLPSTVVPFLQQKDQLAFRSGQAFDLLTAPAGYFEHALVNLDSPRLKHPAVRTALACLLQLQHADMTANAPDLFLGPHQAAIGYLPPLHPLHWQSAPSEPCDWQNALRQAGHTRDATTLRWQDAKGQPTTFDLSGPSDNALGLNVLRAIQSHFERSGIVLTLTPQPASLYSKETLKQRAFADLALHTWVLDPGSIGTAFLSASRIPTAHNAFVGVNYSGWNNPMATAALVQMEKTMSVSEQQAQMAIVRQAFEAEHPMLPRYFWSAVVAVKKGIKGPAPTGTRTSMLSNIETWHFERQ